MTRPPAPISINGFDGTREPTNGEIHAAVAKALTARFSKDQLDTYFQEPEWRNRDPQMSDVVTDIHFGIVASHLVAEYHNALALLVHNYRLTAGAARAALAQVTNTYVDLARTTTTAWHAAHHRYMIAVTDAQAALAEKTQAGNILTTYHRGPNWRGLVAGFYDRLIPADQRITVPDLTGAAAELPEFMETNRRRIQLLSYTLTGAFPAGFEPEEIPEPEPTPTEDDFDQEENNDYRGGRW